MKTENGQDDPRYDILIMLGGLCVAAPYFYKKAECAVDLVSKTLYIPLYGKALVSRGGIILSDRYAEEIWAREGFPLKGKSKSKWLAYFMGMRAAVFDRWVENRMQAHPGGVVLHLGCGLDSRAQRVAHSGYLWHDVDFPEVIRERSRYFQEDAEYRMLAGDIRDPGYLEQIPRGKAIVVMEGVSMYLEPEERRRAIAALAGHFESVELLADCYSTFAAKASRVKNPINDVGVTQVYGLDDPRELETAGIRFVSELDMTPEELIRQLRPWEQRIFRKLYAGKFARKLYRMYEFRK